MLCSCKCCIYNHKMAVDSATPARPQGCTNLKLRQLSRAVTRHYDGYVAATGTLDQVSAPTWSQEAAVDVVIAAPGYPGTVTTGGRITGIDDAEAVPGVHVLHAGTDRDDDGALVASGGRVLSVVALGQSVEAARERAYQAVDAIMLEGSQHRTDIAAGR